MRCKNCGKEIEEYEIFCHDCKKNLKKVSSKNEVSELEDLIEEQRKLNDLEQTKELTDLNILVEKELEEEIEDAQDETINIKINNDKLGEPKTREERFEKDKLPKEKKSKKKIIIIVLTILFVMLVSIIIVFMLARGHKDIVEEETINYKKVINEYGKSIEKVVKNYIEEKEELPTWVEVLELSKYKKYEVLCSTHNIYKDGSIYLNKCKVNNKKTKYSYGKQKKEEKEGKTLNIYKIDYGEGYYAYSDKSEVGSNLIGTVTCKTEYCQYVNAYDKYVIIEEEHKYYLYNYENNFMEFGPFDLSNSYLNNLIFDDHILYGIYYNEEGINNIYSLNNGKVLKNIRGTLFQDGFYNISSVLYKYNYVVLVDKGVNNFINLKTGNISYSIKGTIGQFIEDKKNKLVYMTVYSSNNSFKIYNSNGKSLFNGKEFKYFKVTDDNLLVGTENEYKIYDKKLNLKLSSKKYDSVLGLYEDFIVVVENKNLKILDLDDKEIVKFGFEWDSNRYYFYEKLSGWNTENGKYGIYLIVEDKTVPYGTLGNGLEYYYIPDIKEAGVIETPGFR